MIFRGQPRVSLPWEEGEGGRKRRREVGRKEEETKEGRKKGWTLCLF